MSGKDHQDNEISIHIIDGSDVVTENLVTKVVMPKLDEVFNRLPLVHKKIITDPSLQLILAGKRIATLYNFPTMEEFELFEEIFHDMGIEVSLPFNQTNVKEMNTVWLYDKTQLTEKTGNSKFVVPWTEDLGINEFIEKGYKKGYDHDTVIGFLFDYPESSLDFYNNWKKMTQEAQKRMIDSRQTEIVRVGWDEFRSSSPLPLDVHDSVNFRNIFLNRLNAEQKVIDIMNSDILQKSKDETQKYMPWLKKKS